MIPDKGRNLSKLRQNCATSLPAPFRTASLASNQLVPLQWSMRNHEETFEIIWAQKPWGQNVAPKYLMSRFWLQWSASVHHSTPSPNRFDPRKPTPQADMNSSTRLPHLTSLTRLSHWLPAKRRPVRRDPTNCHVKAAQSGSRNSQMNPTPWRSILYRQRHGDLAPQIHVASSNTTQQEMRQRALNSLPGQPLNRLNTGRATEWKAITSASVPTLSRCTRKERADEILWTCHHAARPSTPCLDWYEAQGPLWGSGNPNMPTSAASNAMVHLVRQERLHCNWLEDGDAILRSTSTSSYISYL